MYDTNGNEVQEFGTFDTVVSVNGNQYTAKFVNGKAIVDADLDSNVEYDVAVKIGNQYVNYKYTPTAGEQGESSSSETHQSEGDAGSQESSNTNNGTSDVQGNSSAQSNSSSNTNSSQSNPASNDDSSSQNNATNPTNSTNQGDSAIPSYSADQGNSTTNTNSSGSHIVNSVMEGNYGTNSSNIQSQDTSDMGNDALSNGDLNAGDSGYESDSGYAGDSNNGEVSKEGKAYEVIPPVKKANKVVDTSGIVVLCIVALLGCLIYGYKRKDEFN